MNRSLIGPNQITPVNQRQSRAHCYNVNSCGVQTSADRLNATGRCSKQPVIIYWSHPCRPSGTRKHSRIIQERTIIETLFPLIFKLGFRAARSIEFYCQRGSHTRWGFGFSYNFGLAVFEKLHFQLPHKVSTVLNLVSHNCCRKEIGSRLFMNF